MLSGKQVLSIAVIVATLSGCGGSSDVLDDLNLHRQKWEQLNVANYQFQSQTSCFCTPEAVAPRNVLVENNQVVSLMVLDSTMALKQDDFQSRTIDQLFSLIALEESRAETLIVEYHSQMGYPTLISVDGSNQVADDEYTIQINGLQLARDTACTEEARPGMVVNLLDAASKELINCSAEITVSEDDFIATFVNDGQACDNNAGMNMVTERSGFYQLTAVRPGYETVELSNIGVARDLCHVATQSVLVEMRALPADVQR